MAADSSSPVLKEIFNTERLQHIATEMTAVHPGFDAKAFLKLARTGLAELSVMQHMARVSECLHAVLALDFEASLPVLRALAHRALNRNGFVSMCLPPTSRLMAPSGRTVDGRAQVLHRLRLFGIRHPSLPASRSGAFPQLADAWNGRSRRQRTRPAPGSEGCRPRLPWSFRLESIQAEPRLAACLFSATLQGRPQPVAIRKSWPITSTTSPRTIPVGTGPDQRWSLDNKHTT